MTEEERERAECWIVQFRVKGRSQKEWGAWSTGSDYRRKDTAVEQCDMQRQVEAGREAKGGTARTEWRVLKVSQEVVY